MNVILDTNILIGIANGAIDSTPFLSHALYVSAITAMELYALAGMSVEEERTLDVALSSCHVVPVSLPIAKRAGVLARTIAKRRQRTDIIIAATALALDMPLITRNIRDFRNIKGLVVYDSVS